MSPRELAREALAAVESWEAECATQGRIAAETADPLGFDLADWGEALRLKPSATLVRPLAEALLTALDDHARDRAALGLTDDTDLRPQALTLPIPPAMLAELQRHGFVPGSGSLKSWLLERLDDLERSEKERDEAQAALAVELGKPKGPRAAQRDRRAWTRGFFAALAYHSEGTDRQEGIASTGLRTPKAAVAAGAEAQDVERMAWDFGQAFRKEDR